MRKRPEMPTSMEPKFLMRTTFTSFSRPKVQKKFPHLSWRHPNQPREKERQLLLHRQSKYITYGSRGYQVLTLVLEHLPQMDNLATCSGLKSIDLPPSRRLWATRNWCVKSPHGLKCGMCFAILTGYDDGINNGHGYLGMNIAKRTLKHQLILTEAFINTAPYS